jgi:hypothetical protein
MESATWVSAIATLLAVLVALFKEEITRLWRRPGLDAAIRLSAPDCHKTEMIFSNPRTGEVIARGDCYYFRIWVENKGNLRANRVQVFAAKLLRQHADGSFKEEKQFLPMNLKWSHSQIKPEIFAEGISPSMGKHCDLGHILDPELRNKMQQSVDADEDETLFELDLEVAPNTLSHILRPGLYRLELKIAAANAKPISRTLEINLTGKWYGDENRMFSDGIGLKEV